MPSYTIKAETGTTKVLNAAATNKKFHNFEFNQNGTATAGSIIIQARRPGAPNNKLITVGNLDFSNYEHIDFVGAVSEWFFTVAGFTGTASLINVTVTSTETGKAEGDGIDPADKAKLDAITSTGSGEVITVPEREKINSSITEDEAKDIAQTEVFKVVVSTVADDPTQNFTINTEN